MGELNLAQHNSEPESALGRFNLDRKQKCLIFFLKAFGIEFLITMVLVLVVFGAAADGNNAPSVKVLFYQNIEFHSFKRLESRNLENFFNLEFLSNIFRRVLLLLLLDCPSQPATSLPSLSLDPGLNRFTKSSHWVKV